MYLTMQSPCSTVLNIQCIQSFTCGSIHLLQAPRAGEAVGLMKKEIAADSFHRVALSDMVGKLNRRLGVSYRL